MTHTIAKHLVEAIIGAGIDTLYCLPGVQNDDFFDALYDRTEALRPVHARHEQGAAYMALGAALATGRPQAFCVVPGPGFLNATAALATAWSLNAPVLAIVGQIESRAVGAGTGMLHEIPDQFAILSQFTRAAAQVRDDGDAAATIDRIVARLAGPGRPGPVGLEIPIDFWKQPAGTSGPATPLRASTTKRGSTPHSADGAARLLAAAQRPLILVGSGALAHAADVRRLAERLDAPVCAFRTGRGVLDSDHPLSVNMPTGRELYAEADVVLGLGTRLGPKLEQWGRDAGLASIQIDVDPAELTRCGPRDVAIEADLADALPALERALKGQERDRTAWRGRVDEVRAANDMALRAGVSLQMAYLDAIRSALPPGGIFVNELTQVGYVADVGFPVHAPHTYLSPGFQGTLGWGLATALGAADARRDVPVVGISGDGGVMFTIGELATAALHDIPLIQIVFKDRNFGNVRRFQIEKYGNRPIASHLGDTDFVALARSFGVEAERAEGPDGVHAAIARAITRRKPTLIEVPVETFPAPWAFVGRKKVRG